jgi:hypothetical protein
MASTFFTPSGGLQDRVDEDGLGQAVPRLELGEELVDVVDVPGALHLRQHHHVELGANLAADLHEVSSSAKGEFSALMRATGPSSRNRLRGPSR